MQVSALRKLLLANAKVSCKLNHAFKSRCGVCVSIRQHSKLLSAITSMQITCTMLYQHDACCVDVLQYLTWTQSAAVNIVSGCTYSGQLQHGSMDSGKVLQKLVGACHTQPPPCTSWRLPSKCLCWRSVTTLITRLYSMLCTATHGAHVGGCLQDSCS